MFDHDQLQHTAVGLGRRRFMEAALAGGAFLLGSGLGIFSIAQAASNEYSMILVDYAKCTGCRICEAVCSAFNHPEVVHGRLLNGLGNPHLSNIRVIRFNPDVDVPMVCAMCPDNPCIEACPVEPDPVTGRRGLYRHEKTGAVTNDPSRCIGCGQCADACRVGIITPNPESFRPERMCTLCGGDPRCVKECPFGALSLVTVDTERELYAMTPERIAEVLTRKWYGAGTSGREG